jgi:hypothetical protein
MSIYNFDSNFSVKNVDAVKGYPIGLNESPAVRQTGHNLGTPSFNGDYEAYPFKVEEFLTPGFRSLDDAMKNYFSGIRVPTKDSYRFMRVKIAGGDKSILIWADDLKEGRVRLPLAAISRDSMEFNPEKYSPAYHPMNVRFVNSGGTKAAKIYRPMPYLVKYSITVWAEFKRDVEYIIHQMMLRYTPLAEFYMDDGHIAGSVQLRFDGVRDASDKENSADQQASVRYDLDTTAEAWLPLPEKIVPTVLGNVATLKEYDALILPNGPPSYVSSWSESLKYQG